MHFSIVTTTYQRPDLLLRSIQSVLSQEHAQYELIIINDSPEHNYKQVEESIKSNARIHYYKNDINQGSNYSKNRALGLVSPDSDYILFLDDDDYLAPGALNTIETLIVNNGNPSWLMSARGKNNTESLTTCKSEKESYSYFFDYLLGCNLKGDATHAIKADMAQKYRFSDHIKNGEEWYYFIQLPSPIVYKPVITTISGGYLRGGLSEEGKITYHKNTKVLLAHPPSVLGFLYLLVRLMKSLIST